MPASSTGVRVFVEWDDEPIYAGDDVKCTITFKNVALPLSGVHSHKTAPKVNGVGLDGEHRHKNARPPTSQVNARTRASQGPRPPSATDRGHRQAMSLNMPSGRGIAKHNVGQGVGQSNGMADTGHKHQRSLSIISIGGGENDGKRSTHRMGDGVRRPQERRHTRATSLQITPRRISGASANGALLSPEHRVSTRPPPSSRSSSFATFGEFSALSASGYPSRYPQRPAIRTAPTTPALSSISGTFSQSPAQAFGFPPRNSSKQPEDLMTVDAPRTMKTGSISDQPSSDPSEHVDVESESIGPLAKVVSSLSINGTSPRSSGEFFSLSNNSTETLASEYISQPSHRLLPKAAHTRRVSHLTSTNHQRQSDALMMGYVQIVGSFTLDGSLVNQAPFEEIKRKGVVGGQAGGGVVGVDTKNHSGLFGALGWSSIGESIGGLLGTGELSSIKEMRGTANSRAIPLLSTPQSLLFVDLHLAPGESKAYRYSFTLPRGLPPSHRGKAIRISYNLIVGTQRAANPQVQRQVRQVEIPFRVYGGVNVQGEPLGHDLLSPHIILKDQARTSSIDLTGKIVPKVTRGSETTTSSAQEFHSYVSTLLAGPARAASHGALLSPTGNPRGRQLSFADVPSTTKDMINSAMLRSNFGIPSSGSTNRFEIARNGRQVATITLARSAYRLGETVIAAIDLRTNQIPSYALHVTLETAETVDPSLALRSNASIFRVTRKSHASQSEATLFAQRVVCSLRIPSSATPEFISSGVSLAWTLRVEFVTPRIGGGGEEPLDEGARSNVLEEISTDERGVVMAARERLPCESFEVAIPVRVYGPASDGSGTKEISASEGLPV
ncbi:MAG: hypothetical protein M1816_002305 [Peltula sp. TS41687]|nr:MAG: hypothetical protein M1816_002305 [Peltula sp. TS41687]